MASVGFTLESDGYVQLQSNFSSWVFFIAMMVLSHRFLNDVCCHFFNSTFKISFDSDFELLT